MPRLDGMLTCTECGTKMNGVSSVNVEQETEGKKVIRRSADLDEEKMPYPGAVTVCIFCGHIMAFDENMQLRNLTPEEEIEIAGNPALMIIQRARTSYIKAHGKIPHEEDE